MSWSEMVKEIKANNVKSSETRWESKLGGGIDIWCGECAARRALHRAPPAKMLGIVGCSEFWKKIKRKNGEQFKISFA